MIDQDHGNMCNMSECDWKSVKIMKNLSEQWQCIIGVRDRCIIKLIVIRMCWKLKICAQGDKMHINNDDNGLQWWACITYHFSSWAASSFLPASAPSPCPIIIHLPTFYTLSTNNNANVYGYNVDRNKNDEPHQASLHSSDVQGILLLICTCNHPSFFIWSPHYPPPLAPSRWRQLEHYCYQSMQCSCHMGTTHSTSHPSTLCTAPAIYLAHKSCGQAKAEAELINHDDT